jgi:hypothetical protein
MDDREFVHLFRFKDTDGIAAAIRARDGRDEIWAFTLPSIHSPCGRGWGRGHRSSR